MLKRERLNSFLNIFLEVDILLILFSLPFSKSIIEICITLAIIAFILKKIMGEKILTVKVDRKILIALALYIFFNLISIVNSQYLTQSILAFFSKALKWAFFFVIIVDTFKSKKQYKRLFVVMLFSCALILVDAFYQQYITGIDFLHYPNRYPVFKFHDRERGATTFPTASFPYPNDFAGWIIIFLFTFVSIATFDLYKRKKLKILTAGFCVLLLAFLFLTTSRGAIIGAFSSLILMLIMNVKKIILPTVLFMVIIAALVAFVPCFRIYLKEEIINLQPSLDDRIGMWSIGWKIFKRHPIIGNGMNTFFMHFKNFRTDEFRYKRGSYAHNCYLQMAADIGLLGLGSFLSFIVFVIYSNVKESLKSPYTFENSFVIGLSLGCIAFLVHSFFDTNLYSLNLTCLFWMCMGFIEGIGSCKYEAR